MAGEKHTDPAWVKKVLATEAEIDRVCENARSQIFDRVRRHMERHPNDGLSGKPLVQLEEALKAVYKATGRRLAGSFRDSLPEVMREAYEQAAREMREDRSDAGKVVGKVDERRIRETLSGAYEQIAGRTSQMSFEHIQKLRALSAEVFRTATLTGATRKEVTKQLISKATEIQGFQFVGNDGRIWKNKAYFEMLARTELMNAGRAAYDEECANNGYDIVQLSFSGNSCPSCTKWEGKIFSLTGVTKGIPTKEDLEADGVFHPNCTHTYTAVPDFELEEMGLDIRQPYVETAAERRDSVDNIDDDSGKNVQIEVPKEPEKPHYDLSQYDNPEAAKKREMDERGKRESMSREIHMYAERHGMTDEEYVNAANNRLVELVKGESLFRRDKPEYLDSILEDGFKSQFITGTSQGSNNKAFRANAEYRMFGFGAKEYGAKEEMPWGTYEKMANVQPELRPIYGFMSKPDELSRGSSERASQYGSLIFKFKDSVKERTTFTRGDSLGCSYAPCPVDKPDITAFGAYAPDVLRDGAKSIQGFRRGYVEIQVHGGVSTEDIERVYINKWDKRKEEIERKLKEKGIPFEEYDGD